MSAVRMLEAKEVSQVLWDAIKFDSLRRYRMMQKAIKQYGVDRVKFLFDQDYIPTAVQISY